MRQQRRYEKKYKNRRMIFQYHALGNSKCNYMCNIDTYDNNTVDIQNTIDIENNIENDIPKTFFNELQLELSKKLYESAFKESAFIESTLQDYSNSIVANPLPVFLLQWYYILKKFFCDAELMMIEDWDLISGMSNNNNTLPLEVLQKMKNTIPFTYNSNFPVIQGSSFTSDIGWGCMHRSSQMLMANAIKKVGYYKKNDTECKKCNLGSFFQDYPSKPFSIHQMTIHGKKYGKKIGEWLGPSTASQIAKDLMIENFHLHNITTIIFQEGTVYEKDILNYDNTLILIPTRLGENLNHTYLRQLELLLRLPQSVGCTGGKPKSAYYILGISNNEVYYVDPHVLWNNNDNNNNNDDNNNNITIRKINATQLDPCIALGFVCQGNADVVELLTSIENICKDHPLVYVKRCANLENIPRTNVSISNNPIPSDSGNLIQDNPIQDHCNTPTSEIDDWELF